MHTKEPIAVVGIGCRFPGGCRTPAEFWELLIGRNDVISEISNERWSTEYYYHPQRDTPGKAYTFAAGQIDDVYDFAPEFFGISPREAVQMDPQHRLLLEMVWDALEDGAQIPAQLAGSDCSVFIGISSTDYANNHFDDPNVADSYFMTGNTLSVAANRISYVFDLHGPSMAIDTACSSSLVALHQACMSIWSEESSCSIIGAAHLLLSPFPFIGFSKASMLSETGRCNVFDSRADGYVRSEGGAVLFLKPLSIAEKNGDPIHAVILETAVNTDGRNSGMTIPNNKAQTDLLLNAYKRAGITPDEVDYIEAHGTGTPVGDPVEAESLGKAIAIHRLPENPLLIGSVKSNIGHLEPASGVAGLLKTILALKHRVIPASLNHEELNPNIDAEELNLKVVNETVTLGGTGRPLQMGVSSFGFGGSNAHAILKEHVDSGVAREKPVVDTTPPLVLSAANKTELKNRAGQFYEFLNHNESEEDYYSISATAANHRQLLEHGLVAYGETIAEIKQSLQAFASGNTTEKLVTLDPCGTADDVVFVFSGNGSQWQGMGTGLLENVYFRAAVNEIEKQFKPLAGWSIFEELEKTKDVSRLAYTEIAQPLLFAVQVGIVAMLRAEGISPGAVIGHSVGEIAAAWAAGSLSLETAVRLIYYRSMAQGKTKGLGKMLAVQLSVEAMHQFFEDSDDMLHVVAINSPNSVTVAGPAADIHRLVAAVREKEVVCHELDLDYAFHSPIMDPVKEFFLSSLENYSCTEFEIEFYSSVTGNRLAHGELDKYYWWRNVRDEVKFAPAHFELLDSGHRLFLEIGPHPVLGSYMHECMKSRVINGHVLPTLRRGNRDEEDRIRAAIYKVSLASSTIGFSRYFPVASPCRRLPPYPWDRKKYLFTRSIEGVNRVLDAPLLGIRQNNIDLAWSNLIDTALFEYLADHVIDGTIVFPAAAYMEMAIACSNLILERSCHEIQDLQIENPMVLEQGNSRTTLFRVSREDLRFSIMSRERLNGNEWVTHASGRLVSAVSTFFKETISIGEYIRNADEEITGESLYPCIASLNFQYGASFRGVEKAWIGEGTVLAKIHLPESVARNQQGYFLHPVLTDSIFHTLFPLLLRREEWLPQRACIPVQIGNLRYSQEGGQVEYGLCRITKLTNNTVTASFLLLDSEGTSVASFNKCVFKVIPVPGQHMQNPGLYHLDFVPKNYIQPEVTTPLPGPDDLDRYVKTLAIDNSILAKEEELVSQVIPLFDALASALTEKAMNKLGAHLDEFTVEDFMTMLDISGEKKNYLTFLLEVLENDGIASRHDETWSLTGSDENDDPVAIWRSILADSPDYIHALLAFSKDGFNLAERLCQSADEKNTEKKNDEVAYTGLTRTQSLANHLLRHLFRFIEQEWPADRRRLRIAEIKNANSRVSVELVSTLPVACCDYELIAGDDLTEIRGNEFLGSYPNVTISRMDIDSPELVNYYREGEFDVIIMQHSLHRSDYLQGTFVNLLYLLASRGLLLIQDAEPSRISSFTGGMAHDWWPPTTDHGRVVSRFNYADEWLNALELAGFEESRDITGIVLEKTHEFLVSGRRPVRGAEKPVTEDVEENTFLLLAEDNGYPLELGLRLNDSLNLQGSHVVTVVNGVESANEQNNVRTVCLENSEQVKSLFDELTSENQAPDNIIFLSDSGIHAGSSEKDISLQIARSAERIITVIDKLAEFNGSKPVQFWLISRQAMHTNKDDRVTEIKNPKDASLWGLGRVIRNEYPDIEIKQVDVHCEGNINRTAKLLTTEILNNDGEEEVILYENTRKVARLREYTGIQGNVENPADENGYQLTLDKFNQASRLQWKYKPRQTLQENEVEIEVFASGLNFRDIMFASGVLPEEMLEDGFTGANLGLECSGVVSGVGYAVTQFQPGDEVIAYAPACFSSHVVCNTTSVVHKPSTWTFEQGATIATAFFTVFYSLDSLARAKPRERVLIHGATGAVGLAAIQYANYRDLEVYATAGTPEKREFLRLLGIEHVYDSRKLDFAEQIHHATGGEGLDIVLNTLSGDVIPSNFSILKPFGRFIELGKRDIYENSRLDLKPFKNNISYFAVDADQVMSHQSELGQRIFAEMMQLFQDGYFRPLAHSIFHAADFENAFSYMQKSNHVGKIVMSFREFQPDVKPEQASQNLQLSAGFTYLITGGLSGFGLETAKWMVEKGARHLVLIGRNGIKAQADKDVIDELEKQGVQVIVELCDVNNAIALQKVLRSIDASDHPLKGVVHSAMVLDDCLINNLTASSLLKVLRPKVNGAWNLHNLTLEGELDFFVMYSSATTCFGNPGQANYVIANSYLESLAVYRRERGLPALTVSWDAILDTGYLSHDQKLKNRFTSQLGIQGIASHEAFESLEKLLLDPEIVTPIVIKPEWSRMRRAVPIANSHLFSVVMHGIDGTEHYSGEDIHELLNGLTENEKQVVVSDILKSEMARILHIGEEKIELHKPIQDIGVDSLMGMELATVINQKFGVDIPLMVLANNITLDSLTKRMIRALQQGDEMDLQSEDSTSQIVSSLATTHAEDISGEEVEVIAEYVDREINTKRDLQ